MWTRFVDTSMIYCDVVQQCRPVRISGQLPAGGIDSGSPDHRAEPRRLEQPAISTVSRRFFVSSLRACRNVQSTAPTCAVSGRDVARGAGMANASSNAVQVITSG